VAEGLIAIGRDLLQAKAEHPREFLSWVSGAVGMSVDTAERLMHVGRTLGSLDSATLRNFPSDRTVLYKLARLDPPQLTQAIETGRINPGLRRKEANDLVGDQQGSEPQSSSGPRRPTPAITGHGRRPAHLDGESVDQTAWGLVLSVRDRGRVGLTQSVKCSAEGLKVDIGEVADFLANMVQDLRGQS
jgi:hypothetical protein